MNFNNGFNDSNLQYLAKISISEAYGTQIIDLPFSGNGNLMILFNNYVPPAAGTPYFQISNPDISAVPQVFPFQRENYFDPCTFVFKQYNSRLRLSAFNFGAANAWSADLYFFRISEGYNLGRSYTLEAGQTYNLLCQGQFLDMSIHASTSGGAGNNFTVESIAPVGSSIAPYITITTYGPTNFAGVGNYFFERLSFSNTFFQDGGGLTYMDSNKLYRVRFNCTGNDIVIGMRYCLFPRSTGI